MELDHPGGLLAILGSFCLLGFLALPWGPLAFLRVPGLCPLSSPPLVFLRVPWPLRLSQDPRAFPSRALWPFLGSLGLLGLLAFPPAVSWTFWNPTPSSSLNNVHVTGSSILFLSNG